MNGQRVVKVFCHEEAAQEDFDVRNEELFRAARAANMYTNTLGPILMNLGNLMYVIVALMGGVFIELGVPNLSISGLGFSIAVTVPFLNMTRQFSGQIGQISQQINSVVMGLAGAERLFELMDEEPEHDEGYVTLVNTKMENGELVETTDTKSGRWAWKHPHHDGTTTLVPLRGDVRLNHVDFGYKPGHTVLHDVTVWAEPGQKIAFVGATGAGKTTITNLINRFYDIEDGKIRYDGININKIKKSDLRRSLGMVLQDVNLFTGTVMDNIRYGRLDASDEECIAAAKLAGAHSFIQRLPEGYNTMLTDNGSNLSQGQRQLLSISRARWRPAGHDLGRGNELNRHAHRGHRAEGHGRAHERAHHLRDRTPPLDRAQLRRDYRARPRPHHRARQPRRAHREARRVLSALYRCI